MNFQTRTRAGSFPTAVNTPSILTSVLISSWGTKEGGVLLRSSGFFFFFNLSSWLGARRTKERILLASFFFLAMLHNLQDLSCLTRD